MIAMAMVLTLVVAADEPTTDNPVVFTAATKSATVKPGGKVELKVSAKILDGWHIYAVDKPVGYSQPTKLVFAAPKGWKSGQWKSSDPHKDANAELETWVHDGEPTFTLEIEVPADAKLGKTELKATVTAMSCNDKECKPPQKHVLKTTVVVAR